MVFENIVQPDYGDDVARVVYSRGGGRSGASKQLAPHLLLHLYLKDHKSAPLLFETRESLTAPDHQQFRFCQQFFGQTVLPNPPSGDELAR